MYRVDDDQVGNLCDWICPTEGKEWWKDLAMDLRDARMENKKLSRDLISALDEIKNLRESIATERGC